MGHVTLFYMTIAKFRVIVKQCLSFVDVEGGNWSNNVDPQDRTGKMMISMKREVTRV